MPAFLLGRLETSSANLVRLREVSFIAHRSNRALSLTKLASAAESPEINSVAEVSDRRSVPHVCTADL
jgi:hypothetical protein